MCTVTETFSIICTVTETFTETMDELAAREGQAMQLTEFNNDIRALIEDYVGGRKTLTIFVTNLEGSAFLRGGEELFALIVDQCNLLADIDASSSDHGYRLTDEQKSNVEACMAELKSILAALDQRT